MPSNVEIRDIGLGGIGFAGDRRMRKLRPELVDELVESMRVLGQQLPIVVCPSSRDGYELISGRHRLEAAKKLKWDRIEARVLNDIDADDALLAEIDENLIRGELTPAERAHHIAVRKEFYEKKHPQGARQEQEGANAHKTLKLVVL